MKNVELQRRHLLLFFAAVRSLGRLSRDMKMFSVASLSQAGRNRRLQKTFLDLSERELELATVAKRASQALALES